MCVFIIGIMQRIQLCIQYISVLKYVLLFVVLFIITLWRFLAKAYVKEKLLGGELKSLEK